VIITVVKRSGVTEPFNRDKIVRGVRRACQGRPVTEDQLALLAQQAEDVIRSKGCGEVPSHEVGLAILGPLRELDEVAYLRFASVYRGFESLADFEDEIASLRTDRSAAADQDIAPRSAGDAGGDEQAVDRTAPVTALPTQLRAAGGGSAQQGHGPEPEAGKQPPAALQAVPAPSR
jgi:transcriptional repressor NrdR